MKWEMKTPMRPRRGRVSSWLEDRLQIEEIWRVLFLRKVPLGVSWFYTLGFASLALLATQALTGIVLAMYYAPTPDHAYDSVHYVMTEVPFGQVIRGIHHWGASAMVVVVVLHLLTVFVAGAYKYPREATWVVGVFLLLVTLGFGFTGYLLPWDEKAYWATTVGTNMAGTVPVIGGFLVRVIRGGAELGALTLTRFYAAHVLLLPATIGAFVAIHLFAVIRQGVSVPPGLWDGEATDQMRPAVSSGLQADGVTFSRAEEYRQRYERFKMRGRPFFPDIIFEDAVVGAVVTLIVVGMAVFVGAPLESEADPTNTAYVPRPEWYFMFLFEMLKYFPGALEWVGVVVVPGLFVLALLALPFVNRGERRSPRYQPLLMGVASVVVLALLALTVMAYQSTPPAAQVSGETASSAKPSTTALTGREAAGSASSVASAGDVTAGGRVFSAKCGACHPGGNAGAGPALRGQPFATEYAEDSSVKKVIREGKGGMPGFPPSGLSDAELDDLIAYLRSLK